MVILAPLFHRVEIGPFRVIFFCSKIGRNARKAKIIGEKFYLINK